MSPQNPPHLQALRQLRAVPHLRTHRQLQNGHVCTHPFNLGVLKVVMIWGKKLTLIFTSLMLHQWHCSVFKSLSSFAYTVTANTKLFQSLMQRCPNPQSTWQCVFCLQLAHCVLYMLKITVFAVLHRFILFLHCWIKWYILDYPFYFIPTGKH